MMDDYERVTPRSGRVKKKSVAAKLAEKKRRAQGISDPESDFGSNSSVQKTNAGNSIDSRYVSAIQTGEGPSKYGYGKSGRSNLYDSESDNEKLRIRGRKFDSDSDQDMTRPTPQPRSRPSQRVDRRQDFRSSGFRRPSPIDDDEGVESGKDDDDEGYSNKSPSDVTAHRFRSLKMASERSNSVESLKSSPFAPKPPTTPRKLSPKAEKRNRDHYSSGDEQEIKKPLSSGDLKSINRNNNMFESKFGTRSENLFKRDNDFSNGINNEFRDREVERTHSQKMNRQSSSGTMNKEPMTSYVNIRDEELRDRTDSMSDYEAMTEKYNDVLNNKMPRSRSNTADKEGLDHERSHTPRSERLAPMTSKNPPPPAHGDYSSRILRTSYRSDPSYFSKDSARYASDNISQRSFTSSSILPTITTKEARSRSFLFGSINSGSSMLGAEELNRYFPDRKVHIMVGTWNMFEIKTLNTSLNDFLLPDESEYVQDIYVIGTQENAMNKKEWEIAMQETLGPSHVLFCSTSHGSLHLAVFIRRDFIWFCSVPETDVVTTRAFTMVKTKGAVAISFTFFGTSFLFLNSHFTSNDKKTQERISDYEKIKREIKLPKSQSNFKKGDDATLRFDSVFWCGDLNFRIDRMKSNVEDMVKDISAQDHPNFERLISDDQLTKCVIEGKAFQGFQEGRINFKPTYKFDPQSDEYDTSAKMRIPSYTDRVLFRSKKKNSISCTQYNAVDSIKVSDHRPVYSLFEAALRPGIDSIPLAYGQFDRDIYIEANKRRAEYREAMPKNQKKSSVCSIQ